MLITVKNKSKVKSVPTKKQFMLWADKACVFNAFNKSKNKKNHEICILIVDESDIAKLNKQYRKKNKPTNILSFNFSSPMDINMDIDTNYLGDLVICAPVVRREAKEQNKTIVSHWAHLTVHGVLHLLGYDHEKNKDAEVMEQLEVKILQKLGFVDPYEQVT